MSVVVDPKHPLPSANFASHPFYLIGAIYAALMMGLWVPWFLGFIQVPSAWPAQAWFAHELVLGFAPLIVAGVLLTGVSRLSGNRPFSGVLLAALAVVWLFGRIAVGFSAHLDAVTMAAFSIAFLLGLSVLSGRVIAASGDWRDLAIVALLFGLGAADALFHYEMFEFGRTTFAADIALAFALLLLMIIAGRLVSSEKRRPIIFHVACGFVVLGFVLTCLGVLWDDYDFKTGGIHAWTVGSIGALAFAIMTCASRAWRSPNSASAIVVDGLLLISGLAWTVAGLYPQWTLPLLPVSGIAWIAAFAGFALLYGRSLIFSKSHER